MEMPTEQLPQKACECLENIEIALLNLLISIKNLRKLIEKENKIGEIQ